MINTEKQKESSDENSFFSLKNKSDIQFGCEAERLLMLLCEFDPLVDAYKQFVFKMVSIRSSNELDSSPALIVDGDGKRQYIILSDRLAENEHLAQQVCEQLQKSEASQIALTVIRPIDVENCVLAKNVAFLYQYALLPAYREDFSVINNHLDFGDEIPVIQLKRRVKNEAAIYQLMFHRGLRADLEDASISDETIVTASPIINSIIKSL